MSQGYNVVGIDASLQSIEEATIRYSNQIKSGQLVLEHCAITKSGEDVVDFYLSDNSVWSSINKKIATRRELSYRVDSVPGKPLSCFFEKYGVPYYCKIDIEGYDVFALQSLQTLSKLPKYISVETECIGEEDVLNEEEILATLTQLHKLGYNRFKLIDQVSLNELLPNIPFYGIWRDMDARTLLSRHYNYPFKIGSSGVFGKMLGDKWLMYNEAIHTLLSHRKQFFNSGNWVNYAFWCDWHATRI